MTRRLPLVRNQPSPTTSKGSIVNPKQALEAAAIAIVTRRKEEPDGKHTEVRMSGHRIGNRTTTFLETAREDARAAIEAAAPGFLDGKSVLVSKDAWENSL